MDLILAGAELRDPAHSAPLGDALAVSAGRIAALGAARDVVSRRVRGTRVVRLHGGTLLPGFVDAHLHLRALARRRASLDCSPARDAESLLRLIEGASAGGMGWLHAHGLEHRLPGFGALPVLPALDRAARGRPLWLRHRSGHMSLLNRAALRELGWIERDPPEGTLERSGGTPSGAAFELESAIARRLRGGNPPASPESIATTARDLLRAGTTAFADLTPTNAAHDLDRWWADHDAGLLPQAMSLWVDAESLQDRVYPGPQDAVRLGGIKVMPRLRGAAWTPDARSLAELMGCAARAGWPVAVHAVEADAVVLVLEALRELRARPPYRVPRLRMEHLNLLPPALLEDIAREAMEVCVQPGLLWRNGAAYRETVPREQWPWLFPTASLSMVARVMALGSDAPAAPESLLRHAAAACARVDREGVAWNLAERIAPIAALASITGNASRVAGLADLCGSFLRGVRGDAVYFELDWTALRRGLSRGVAPIPAATLCRGIWHDWR